MDEDLESCVFYRRLGLAGALLIEAFAGHSPALPTNSDAG